MSFIYILLVAITVSIDGFFSGFAFGLKRRHISLNKLIFISLIALVCVFLSMCIGLLVKGYIESYIANIIGALLLIWLAFNSLKTNIDFDDDKENKTENISLKDSALIGFAVAIDAAAAAFPLSIIGYNIFLVSISMSLAHFVLVGCGNYLSLHSFSKLSKFTKYIPFILFMILAIFRII